MESAKQIAKMTLFNVQNVNYGSIARAWECLRVGRNPLLSLGLLKRLVSSVVPFRLVGNYAGKALYRYLFIYLFIYLYICEF